MKERRNWTECNGICVGLEHEINFELTMLLNDII